MYPRLRTNVDLITKENKNEHFLVECRGYEESVIIYQQKPEIQKLEHRSIELIQEDQTVDNSKQIIYEIVKK